MRLCPFSAKSSWSLYRESATRLASPRPRPAFLHAPPSSSRTCGEHGECAISRVGEKNESTTLRDPGARLEEEDVQSQDELQDKDVPDARELVQAAVAFRVAQRVERRRAAGIRTGACRTRARLCAPQSRPRRAHQRETSLGRDDAQPEGGDEERVALDGVVAQRADVHCDEVVLAGILPSVQRGAARRVRVCV